MLILSFITVFFAYQAIQEAKDSTIFAKLTVNNTAQMVNKTAEMVNKTTEMVKWYYEPQPQLNLWTSVDYELNNDGYVYVDKWWDYDSANGFNIGNSVRFDAYIRFGNNSAYYETPGYLSCCKNIKISLYNSGRGSIIFPLISFDLGAKNKSDGILFKFHTIRTPIDKLEYDPIKKYMFESDDFIENQQISMPYGNKYDFPPYLDENKEIYFIPTRFSKDLLPYIPNTFSHDERSDVLGPFRIGTISPGEAAEIELKIFSTVDDCTEGRLNIRVQSLNTEISNRIINLKTGRRDTCKGKEELEKYIKSRYS